MNAPIVEFELRIATAGHPVRIRIREFEARAAAFVDCGSASTSGLGGTAREALVAALAPFGARTSTAVMAAPEMFGASAQVLAARA
jgi:hypothetical protein